VLILGAIFFLAFLLLAILAFPWRLLSIAIANARRADGTLSRKRARIEYRKVGSFVAEVVLVPLLATTLLTGSLFVVDRFVIPLPLLRDVISLFDVRFSVWDENMETGEFGDVGMTYGEWAASRGYSAGTSRTIRKFMKNNWLPLTLLAILAAVFVYWFVVRYYLSVLLAYRGQLLERRERYRLIDVVRSIEVIH
jgi:hypothetical protein